MRNKVNLSKTQLYWLFHILGWSSIVVVETINYTFIILGSFQWAFVTSFGKQAIYGILVTHFYKALFIKKSTFEKPLRQLLIKGLWDTFNISFIITVFILGYDLYQGWEEISEQIPSAIIELGGWIMNQARYVVVWIIIYYMYQTLQRNQAIMKENFEMDNLLTTTELELLKTQLNPHFLFNALNSIKALVLIDEEKARDAIVKLSELLQFSLSYEKIPLISMKEEIYKVEKYLELEKIRFGSRLDYRFNVSEAVMDLQVPPALVLTLAENAIKHGITQLPDGGQIQVMSRLEGENLKIEVLNTGQLKAENVKGIGLKNVRSRLKNLFGAKAEISLVNKDSDQVLVSVMYPTELQHA